MARVIEFYLPTGFHKRVKWIPLDQRGKVLEFTAEESEEGLDEPILSMPRISAVVGEVSTF